MPRKGENIHKRKDGRWEARIRITAVEGKTRYKSLYGKTYKEAKDKLLNERKLNSNKISSHSYLALSIVLEEWILNNRLKQKESTQLKYQNIINNHINPILGNRDICKIDEADINDFLIYKLNAGRLDKKGSLSASYVKTMGIILNAALNYAIYKGYREPLKAKIIKPCDDKKEIMIMEKEVQKELENSLKKDGSSTAIGIMLALNAGLRIGEICALSWEEVDLKLQIIHVRKTVTRIKNYNNNSKMKTCLILDKPKTKTSIRDIPINSKLLPVLIDAKEKSNVPYVVSEGDAFLSPRTLEYRYHKMLEKYNIPSMNFHALRHTFATRCVELGVDVKSLSELLGHANVGITLNTYVHSSIEQKRNQLEKLALLGA